MPTKVAILTPASLDRLFGDSLRPLMQARGLWAIGWRDFVVFTPSPDPTLPFDQQKLDVRGPLRLVPPVAHGCRLAHAHQNAGLFLQGRFWADLHGLAPLEARLAWQERPWSPGALGFYAFSAWATRRLVARAERILCAGPSIARNLGRWARPASEPLVLRNALDPGQYPASPQSEPVVIVIGGFTSRWGRTSLPLALAVARLCPNRRFRLVGAMDAAQAAACAATSNVQADGPLDEAGFRQALQDASVALIPFADWCRGGGARQKLIQAAASGLAIVATPSALEGFEADEAILVGRSPTELAEHVDRLMTDAEDRRRRGRLLREAAGRLHDWRAEAQRLAELYESALGG
jgi:glycosyltransferase involved in cell wall biosynthesis